MKLDLWIHKNYKFQKEFADILGISEVRLSRFVNGVSMPSSDEMARIESATDGRVKKRDFKKNTNKENDND